MTVVNVVDDAEEPFNELAFLVVKREEFSNAIKNYTDMLEGMEVRIQSLKAGRRARQQWKAKAVELEAFADGVEEAAAKIDKTIAPLVEAFRELEAPIPADYDKVRPLCSSIGKFTYKTDTVPLAGIVLAEALYYNLPEIFARTAGQRDRTDTYGLYRFFELKSGYPSIEKVSFDPLEASTAANAAAYLFGDRSRAAVSAIRSGGSEPT